MYKKKLTLLLSLTMIISMIPVNVFATIFSDMPNNWSTVVLEKAVANGLISGDNSRIMADENLTRAQMATILNRAFGTLEKSSIKSYSDIPSSSWYYDEMAKAAHMGIIKGSNNRLYPDDYITREETFEALARVFKLSLADLNVLDIFSDKELVSDWAKYGVTSLVSEGYISGSDGKLNPKKHITRAEFAKIMDNLIKNYISDEGTFTVLDNGNTMINVPNVTLKDLTVKGDLIIGDGVSEGYVILDNIIVEGRTIVRGGKDSIKIINNSDINKVIIAKVNGTIKLSIEDGVEIEKIIVDGNCDVIIEGNVETVVISSPNILVNIIGHVTNIEINETANDLEIFISKGALVKSIIVNSINVEIYGKGKIATVEANSDNISVSTTDTLVKATPGSTGVTAGGMNVKPGRTTNTTVDDEEDDEKDFTEDDDSGNLGGIADIDYGYFTFNPTNGTITGYSRSGPKDVVIPSEINGVPVTVIGSGALDNLDLSSLVLPDTIVIIRDSAFAYNNLTNLVIPNSVEIIDSWSFYMNNITNLTIGNKVKRIGDSAFEFSSLTSVTIPDSVTFLGNYAFRENKLTKINIGSGASIGELFLTGFIIAPNNNFRDAYYPEKKAGTYIGTTEGTWTRLTEEQYFIFDRLTKTITNYDNEGGLSVGIPPNIGGISVENIGKGAFDGKNLNRLVMQNTIKIIGENAFSNNSLNNIIIPSGVTSIGDGSFANNSIGIVSIPSSVNSIGNSAFLNNSLNNITIPNNVTTIGNSAFQYNNLASASIGSSVANIGSNAFSYNNLTTLSFPGSLRNVGNSAFAYNNISEIKINTGVTLNNNMLNSANDNFRSTYIVSGAGKYLGTQKGTWIKLTDEKYFSFDSSTKTITGYNNAGGLDVVIPPSINGVQVLKIGDRAFVSKGLTNVVIPDTVTNLEYMSFGYNALSNIEFPNSLIEIGGRAFCGNMLSNLEIGDNVISIEEHAFSENQLVNVTLNNKLKYIGESAFWKNSIKEVIIPDSVTKIGLAAYAVNAITYVELGDGLTEIDAIAFAENEISTIIFGSNIAIIGEGVFRDNRLTSVTIPTSVTSIDRYAFMNNRLINVTIPDNVTISYCVFTNNNLSSITIGSGVILGEYLLDNYNNNFRVSYITSGAGIFHGTQSGTWKKLLQEAPIASFTCNPIIGDSPLTVVFSNTSTGAIDSYSWDFNGDGTRDSISNTVVNFTYNTPGTYTAMLTVANAGGSNSTTMVITVNETVPPAPIASFTCNPIIGDAPLSVEFSNTSTGIVDSYSWDFNGDGTPDNTTDLIPNFTYNTPGTYTAMLTVVNAGGSNSITKVITVNETVPLAPIARFTCNPTIGAAPLTVEFSNTSTGKIDTYSWDLNGDGTPDNTSDSVVNYTYDTSGTYTAMLTVVNAGGSNSTTMKITVN